MPPSKVASLLKAATAAAPLKGAPAAVPLAEGQAGLKARSAGQHPVPDEIPACVPKPPPRCSTLAPPQTSRVQEVPQNASMIDQLRQQVTPRLQETAVGDGHHCPGHPDYKHQTSMGNLLVWGAQP